MALLTSTTLEFTGRTAARGGVPALRSPPGRAAPRHPHGPAPLHDAGVPRTHGRTRWRHGLRLHPGRAVLPPRRAPRVPHAPLRRDQAVLAGIGARRPRGADRHAPGLGQPVQAGPRRTLAGRPGAAATAAAALPPGRRRRPGRPRAPGARRAARRSRRALAGLSPGGRVRLRRPLQRSPLAGAADEVVLIALGVGVTPHRAVLRHLAAPGRRRRAPRAPADRGATPAAVGGAGPPPRAVRRPLAATGDRRRVTLVHVGRGGHPFRHDTEELA